MALAWWTITLCALLWGWLQRNEKRVVRDALVASSLAWVAVVGWHALPGGMLRVLQAASGTMQLPVWSLPLASLGLTMLLSGIGAWVGAGGSSRTAGR